MKSKNHIKKGETVKVISGEYKGQEGKVLSIDHKNQRAVVESINMISKSTRPTQDNPKGGFMKQEGSIHISNLLPSDPNTGEPTRVGSKKDENGNKVRFAKKSGEIIK